jgi:hypothetical protein
MTIDIVGFLLARTTTKNKTIILNILFENKSLIDGGKFGPNVAAYRPTIIVSAVDMYLSFNISDSIIYNYI